MLDVSNMIGFWLIKGNFKLMFLIMWVFWKLGCY